MITTTEKGIHIFHIANLNGFKWSNPKHTVTYYIGNKNLDYTNLESMITAWKFICRQDIANPDAPVSHITDRLTILDEMKNDLPEYFL